MRVRQRYTKWGGHQHWEFDTTLLGTDEFGTWLWMDSGVAISRPDASFVTAVSSVTLVSEELWSTPTFHATWEPGGAGHRFAVYVDIATPAVWAGGDVTMVDLDLDVVQLVDGTIEVLDEDEFAVHQVTYGYPADVVAAAQRSCDDVVAAMTAGAEPYASVGWDWLRGT